MAPLSIIKSYHRSLNIFASLNITGGDKLTHFLETTTLTNLMTGTYSNEDALMQDVPLLARKIAEFVNDPVKFKKENQP